MLNSALPADSIRLSFIDIDGIKVDNITVEQANQIAQTNPEQRFLFQTGDGTQQELSIDQVNQLQPQNLLPTAPECSSGPQECGPPLVQFFGGGGFGATANAIISPISSSIIGFDIVNAGKNYINEPFVNLYDPCGKGSGANLSAVINGNGQLQNILIQSSGNGYLSFFDGSLGGNERVWKEADEGYVLTANGEYYVVPFGTEPTLNEGDTYFPPSQPQRAPIQTIRPTSVYPVVLALDEIRVVNTGFGYRPGDQIIITPNQGAVLEPVINQYGEIEKVNIINPGLGFEDLPDIRTDSPTGFNAQMLPILKVIPLKEIVEKVPPDATVISVVDCVGKIPPKTTFDIVPR
jgi:hypothetical protein